MPWSWESPSWPNFSFNINKLNDLEAKFLSESGISFGAYTHISDDDKFHLKVELLSDEALKTSEIEGELLNRDSIQVSISRHFGFQGDNRKIPAPEQGIAAMMTNLFSTYHNPLSHESLYHWHELIMHGRHDLKDLGAYRTQPVPTQIVSGSMVEPKIHYEAPPSKQVYKEMSLFVEWFNATAPKQKKALPPLIRAGIAHLYFVLIHPFEDGNGRIARALAEKALAQGLSRPSLIALSYTIERNKKQYYTHLEQNNKGCDINNWLEYFAQTILQAQENTLKRIQFIIEKKQFFERLKHMLNPRQEKAINRLFVEGIDGFRGGLSAHNYMSITKATTPTATRDLNDLVAKNALVKKGKLRYTRYYLNIPTILKTLEIE